MDTEDNGLKAFGGLLLALLVAYWFWAVVLAAHDPADPPWIFLDYANLIFHEAGHIVFMPFGEFMHVLGGSLMQLLVPGLAFTSFLMQSDGIASGFALFWLGESLSNLSYYVADARAQALPLLGGDPSGHDWSWLLDRLHALPLDTAIGGSLRLTAALLMLAGLSMIGIAAYRAYHNKNF